MGRTEATLETKQKQKAFRNDSRHTSDTEKRRKGSIHKLIFKV